MPLSQQEIERLLQLIGRTAEDEITCEQCLELVAEFAERRMAGESIASSLLVVEQHLEVCDECREEYEALLRTLHDIDEQG